MKWSYGITTIPARRKTYFPTTMESLKNAGFDKPHLFLDGKWHSGYEAWDFASINIHTPCLRTHGNWITALWSIYVHEPHADRYALFQDDFIMYPHTREYLEQCGYPSKCYLNLYSFPKNEKLSKDLPGWHRTDQLGKGAVALVFNRDAVVALLSSDHMARRPIDLNKGWKSVDGGIVTGLKIAGYHERCHNPSLTQHIGDVTSMGNRKHAASKTWKGLDFDPRTLLKETVVPKEQQAPSVGWKRPRGRMRWDKFMFAEAIDRSEGLIVEIGGIRDIRPIARRADGHSTVHFARTGRQVISIDTDMKATRGTTQLTTGKSNVSVVNGDGLQWLKDNTLPIGLLYLDGPDVEQGGAHFSLKAFQAAEKSFTDDTVILIDDCDLTEDGGKGALLIPYTERNGWTVIRGERQCIIHTNPRSLS